jgi:hypothetical protein
LFAATTSAATTTTSDLKSLKRKLTFEVKAEESLTFSALEKKLFEESFQIFLVKINGLKGCLFV